jgi:hypothetical protein
MPRLRRRRRTGTRRGDSEAAPESRTCRSGRRHVRVVHAEFVATGGTRFDGYVTPQKEARIGWVQPTIVTATGQVGFWLGGFPPRPGRLDQAYGIFERPRLTYFLCTIARSSRTVVSCSRVSFTGSCISKRRTARRSSPLRRSSFLRGTRLEITRGPVSGSPSSSS